MDTTRSMAVSNTGIRTAEEQTAAQQQLKLDLFMEAIAVIVIFLLAEFAPIVSPSRTFVNESKTTTYLLFPLFFCSFLTNRYRASMTSRQAVRTLDSTGMHAEVP